MSATGGLNPELLASLSASREDIADNVRIERRPGDSPVVNASRQYLRHRLARRRTERELGKAMAIPYRVPEALSAARLMMLYEVKPVPLPRLEAPLLKLARHTVDIAALERSVPPLH